MSRTLLRLFALLFVTVPITVASAQSSIDEVISWRSYSNERSARVQVFNSGDRTHTRTVVIEETNDATGGPVTDEARYVADTIGRTFGFDPVDAVFVFRFQIGSTTGVSMGSKVLLLRATFRRGNSGDLGSPSWRVISPEALSDLTDRAL